MVNLTFYWDTWAIFKNDDVFRMMKREDFEGESWKDCCDECLKYSDWDDSDLVKGYESNVVETNRKLKEITTDQNGQEVEVSEEVYNYYHNSMKKLEEKVKSSKEEGKTGKNYIN